MSSLKKYRICLTGGPCAGKSTGMTVIANYFENLGWKVYCVQEMAEIFLKSDIVFADLHGEQLNKFQRNLIYSIMALEKFFFDLAELCKQNCLVICDRGIIDGFVYTPQSVRVELMKENKWTYLDIRDNRYDIVIHFVTAANNAEKFYVRTEIRREMPEEAQQLDILTAQEWMAHPRYYVIDNSTNLDGKIKKAIFVISEQLGIQIDKNLESITSFSQSDGMVLNLADARSKPVKFIVSELPDDLVFPKFEDYNIIYHYLETKVPNAIESIQKRGINDSYNYHYKLRKILENDNMNTNEVIKDKKKLEHKEYLKLLGRKNPNHYVVFIKRRHFIWKGKICRLDIFNQPKSNHAKNLILLKMYSNLEGNDLQKIIPDFLKIIKNVSDDPKYERYNISLKNPSDQDSIKIFQRKPSFGYDNLF